ncbi:hypothetical protein MPSEU_000685300 [Mayamaea pseudoterrestris]|nr:hypothetical protein MPSEU_000685300 [Mayamaea pseudoterrestris]
MSVTRRWLCMPFAAMEVAVCLVAWSFAPRLIEALGPSFAKPISSSINMKIFGVERNVDIPACPTEDELKMEEKYLPGCEHHWYESCVDGVNLHYRKMAPTAKPKAILVYVHGIQTHGGKAFVLDNGRKVNLALLAETCFKENIALYAPDMYGHGYSEGMRWMIPDTWENNLKDLKNFVKLIGNDYDPMTPLFVMGESYGGTLTIHLARQYQDEPDTAPKGFAGILLTGPAIIGDVPPYPVYVVLRYILAPLFPKWIPFFMPNPVSADRIWRDAKVLAMHTTPRMKELKVDSAGSPFRLGTAKNLLAALETVRSQAIPGLTVPFCIAHGTKDMGVPIEGSEYMVHHVATPKENAEFHRITDAYHDLLADPMAEEEDNEEEDDHEHSKVLDAKPLRDNKLILAAAFLALAMLAVTIIRNVSQRQQHGRHRFHNQHENIISIHQAHEHFLTIPNTTLQLWYRVWGNLHSGIPLLFVHGGPGNAVADYANGNARFFPAETYFVVEVDQRGTGQSQPSVRDDAKSMQYYTNVTIDMIASDYELIRNHLGIQQWMVWGGSYGSTVALTYAAQYPERCAALILRGIYLESKGEVEEVYSRVAHLNNSKRLREFDVLYDYAANELVREGAPPLDANDAEGVMKTYERLIQRGDRHAIWHWWTFENNLMEWDPNYLRDPHVIDEEDFSEAQSVAFFETRLWVHGSYEAPNHILKHLAQVAQLPIWICQGLKDEVCPYGNAQRLVDTLEHAGATELTYRFVPAGHEDTDIVMAECLHESIREYTHFYQNHF